MNQLSRWTCYSEMDKEISSQMGNIATGFVYLGYLFKQARDTELFKEAGYTSLYEYVQDKYNITRTQAIRFMQINDTYSVDGNSEEINPQYIGYGSSKLTEMLGIPEEIRTEIPVEVTVKELRNIKAVISDKNEEENSCATVAQTQVNTSTETENNTLKKLVFEFFRQNKNSFKDYFKIVVENIDFLSERLTKDKLFNVIAPSKFRMARLNCYNVIFKEDLIKAMPMSRDLQNQEFTYNEFVDKFIELFNPEDLAAKTAWENNYQEAFEDPKPIEVKISSAAAKKDDKKKPIVTKPEPEEQKNKEDSKNTEDTEDLENIQDSENTEESEEQEEDNGTMAADYIEPGPPVNKSIFESQVKELKKEMEIYNGDVVVNTEESEQAAEQETDSSLISTKEDEGQIEIQDYAGIVPEPMKTEIIAAEVIENIPETEFTITAENVDQILNNFSKDFQSLESYIYYCIKNHMHVEVKVLKGDGESA